MVQALFRGVKEQTQSMVEPVIAASSQKIYYAVRQETLFNNGKSEGQIQMKKRRE